MVAVAPPSIGPTLSDSEAAFVNYFGRPIWRRSIADGAVSGFGCSGAVVAVLFQRGYAVAVRAPYAVPQGAERSIRQQPADFQTERDAPVRLLIGDRGWIIATEACGWPEVHTLAIS